MTTETLGQGDHLTERQLRLLIEQAPVAISMFDRDMRYLVASRRWLEDYQLDAAIVGRSLYEVFPEMPERWKAIHRRVLGGEVLKAEQDHFERADRVVQWLRWEMRPWRDIDGEIGGIVIFTEDVTDRRLADEQRQLFVSLAQSSRDFIGMCDAQFRPFFVNAAGLRMVGLGSLDEATRTPVKEFFFPEDQAFIMHEFFPRVQLEGCGEVEIRFRHFVTRKPLWMQYSVFSLTEVTSGQTSGYATVSRNITENKRAQQQLIEAQHRLQAVMRAAPVGIVGISYSDDPSCEHITGNPALLSQFEIGPDENISASASEPTAVGRQVRFFRDGREIAAHELPLQRAVAEAREIPPMQLEVLLPSGRRWFAEASAAPILGEQAEIIGGVAVTVDITEHLRIEQALRENDRRKDEFLAMLAHELRNPLAPIQNGLHVLQKLDGGDPVSKDRAHSVLTIVERQVAHLTRLVDDLLETARITAGKIEVRKQHVDLATVIQQALQLSEPLIQAGKHKISISLDHQPLIVDGDPVRLTQVFANLLNNAAKYTPPEGRNRNLDEARWRPSQRQRPR